jgi:non-ribosomal peptide synthetase component E (peptide arylation enzyme)
MPDTPLPPAPPAHFNFAQHLIALNAHRPQKIAYIDDAGTLSYGELAERQRRLAAGLLALGLRREERVLLLMHDSSDWAVSFLGALYAGIVKGLEVGNDNDPVTYYVGGSLATPWKEVTVGAAYDYLANGSFAESYGNATSVYLNFQATEKLKLNGRFEYATSSGNTFVAGNEDESIIGVTGTADYALFANVVTRVEVRWDTITGGSTLRAVGNGDEKNDVSIALNVIYKF